MVSSKRRTGRLKADTDSSTEVLEEDEGPNTEEDTESTPKYQTKQRVYARDASSSLWYEAIIRRSLYGVHHNKQVQIGLVSSESEIEEILAQSEAPAWHYFVHYNKWNTNWDRWVSEEDIMEDNDESKRIADRYLAEHKQLQKEMKQKGKGKGDGTAFLNAWRTRMEKVEEELKKQEEEKALKKMGTKKKEVKGKTEQQSAKPKPKSKKKTAADKWDKTAIAREYKLRLRGLEGKRSSQDQHKMALPFSLKKVMVEAWEIITQCRMVPRLPAPVTVRQGLDKYLQSKLELIVPAAASSTEEKKKASSPVNSPGAKTEEDEEEKLQKRRQEWINMVEGLTMFFDDALPFRLLYSQELSQYKIAENTFVVPADVEPETAQTNKDNANGEDDETGVKTADADVIVKEGVKAADAAESDKKGGKTEDTAESGKEGKSSGDVKAKVETVTSASQSDENAGQFDQTMGSSDEKKNNKEKTVAKTRKMMPSEIYGCEHLLRLCLKIPEMLAEQMPTPKSDDESGLDALAAYEQESKQILAKVNDLVRFLHKNQSTVFADSYRKLNDAENREDQKFVRSMERNMERKRKRSTEDKPETSSLADNPGTKEDTATTNTDANPPSIKVQKVSS